MKKKTVNKIKEVKSTVLLIAAVMLFALGQPEWGTGCGIAAII